MYNKKSSSAASKYSQSLYSETGPKSKKGPGDPPKKRSYTMVPTGDRAFVQGTGKDKGRVFSETPVPGKLKKVMRANMREEMKEGLRSKEDYRKGVDSTMTQSEANVARKAENKSKRKATMEKIKKKLPKGGKGMWGPMSSCSAGEKNCK